MRLPFVVDKMLPEVSRERVPRLAANRTTVTFPWDFRIFVVERGDGDWTRISLFGHRHTLETVWTRRAGPGWGAWLRGSRAAYVACRAHLHMARRESVRWVWRARP